MDKWEICEAAAKKVLEQVTVWRGQWGGEAGLRSALPTIAFGSHAAATIYAHSPNDRTLSAAAPAPQVFEARLTPSRVYARMMPDAGDSFLDLDVVAEDFGDDMVDLLIREFGSHIKDTGSFEHLFSEHGIDLPQMPAAWREGRLPYLPPMQAYLALQQPEFVEALRGAGYDAVLIGGCGMNAREREWHALDPAIIRDPMTGERLPLWSEEPEHSPQA